jgi:hypothetical protein
MESTFTLTVLNTKETGKMTSNMVRAMRHGQMVVSFMVIMSIQRKKERVSILGLTEIST